MTQRATLDFLLYEWLDVTTLTDSSVMDFIKNNMKAKK